MLGSVAQRVVQISAAPVTVVKAPETVRAMTDDLDTFALFTGLFGGLALFLFGMDLMTAALKRVAGDQLKDLLGKVTGNRFMGVGLGAIVTGLVNSSSVTTVIVVGFISAGLMSMAQSVSVIMGANIGSTVTAQILAFNVTRFALPTITLGFLISFLSKRQDWQDYGRMLLGLGLVFYGMGLMSAAMAPLRSNETFLDFIATLQNPVLAVVTGIVFTAIIQSSAATTGIVIVLAGQGVMTLETAIAVAMGANIGTCATAGLAAIGKPREAVRAAVVHVLFNVAGVLIWILFIDRLAEITLGRLARGRRAATSRERAHDLQRGKHPAVHWFHDANRTVRRMVGAGQTFAARRAIDAEVPRQGTGLDTGLRDRKRAA